MEIIKTGAPGQTLQALQDETQAAQTATRTDPAHVIQTFKTFVLQNCCQESEGATFGGKCSNLVNRWPEQNTEEEAG